MAYSTYKVYSFAEYIQCVTDIGNACRFDTNKPNVLWSRGHREESWNLRPTLLRVVSAGQGKNELVQSSQRAVEEELRKQHYIAKSYHFLPKDPKSDLEWMEVMQHHGVETRVLDWSESMIHSVIFALECFFNNEKFQTDDRINCSPCVWILEPVDWNMAVLSELFKNTDLINECIESLPHMSAKTKKEIEKRMGMLETEAGGYLAMDSAKHLKGLFNLSSMVGELQEIYGDDLVYHLAYGEYYYCLFYLLKYVYMETKPKKTDEVFPLSMVESYHSERIRAQKGTFTIFPYYEEDPILQSAKNFNIYLDSMENMSIADKYLQKILLCDPDKIAFEIMNAGINVTWLYPEMPIVANTIANRQIFF